MIAHKSRSYCALAVLLLIAAPAFGQIEAQKIGQPELPSQEPRIGLKSAEELEAFIDGLMVAHLEAYDTAGATVSVVKDGRLFFAKGYGYADVEAKKKVEANGTLFRIGSVSKLFVWTSVMQLVEQGLLDLDEDINTYLEDFQIPATFEEPITLSHLMAHNPGFDDVTIELFARTEENLLPLGEVIQRQLPTRVRPPGVVTSYSNHGTAMAAHIVELVSEQSWDEYVEEHIFEPLQMGNTTFRQPVPDALSGGSSKGYKYKDGRFEEQGFEFVPVAPVGSASATATDMANFMMAHLQFGSFGLERILGEATSRTMQQDHFKHHPGVNGMAHGFMGLDVNGQRVIGHGGNTLLFHSMLGILPEHNTGFFVSYNSEKGDQATQKFFEAIMDRYFPDPDEPQPAPPATTVKELDRFAGVYRPNRYSHTSPAKLAVLGTLAVRADKLGFLSMTATPGVEWYPTETPALFREKDGQRSLAFEVDEEDTVTDLYFSWLPVFAFERVRWFESSGVQLLALVSAMIAMLSALFLWPVGALVRRRFRIVADPDLLLPRYARVTAACAYVLLLGFPLMMAYVFLNVFSAPSDIVFGIPIELEVALYLPLLALVVMTGVAICALIAWTNGHGTIVRRLYYSIVALAAIGFLVQLNYWNLLGLNYRTPLAQELSHAQPPAVQEAPADVPEPFEDSTLD